MIPAFRVLFVTFVVLGAVGISAAVIQGVGFVSVITLLAWVPLSYLIASRTKGPNAVLVAARDVEIRPTRFAARWLAPRMTLLILPLILAGFALPYWTPAAAGFALGLAARCLVVSHALKKRQSVDDVVWLLRVGRWRGLAALERCTISPALQQDHAAQGVEAGT
jgi:hypothetical protein